MFICHSIASPSIGKSSGGYANPVRGPETKVSENIPPKYDLVGLKIPMARILHSGFRVMLRGIVVR